MNNFTDYLLPFTTQADADNVFQVPLNTKDRPMTLLSAIARISAVAGSPTAVTLDVDLTDGTTTYAAIAAGALGTAAAQVTLEPSDAIKFAGQDTAPQLATPIWRADVDFNFTGGSSPTVTGWLVLRFAH